MKGTVAASNASLLKVCQGTGMRCIDHTSSFIAYSGAPRQDLCSDPLHPSAKGTGRPQQKPALLQPPSPLLAGQFRARQHKTNAWHSVQPAPGQLPSMMPPSNQRRGYNNVQQQPYRHFPRSCPPSHYLPADNVYPSSPYYPYVVPLDQRADTKSDGDVLPPHLLGSRTRARGQPFYNSIFRPQHIMHMHAAETLV